MIIKIFCCFQGMARWVSLKTIYCFLGYIFSTKRLFGWTSRSGWQSIMSNFRSALTISMKSWPRDNLLGNLRAGEIGFLLKISTQGFYGWMFFWWLVQLVTWFFQNVATFCRGATRRGTCFFLMPLSENHTEGQGWGWNHDCLYWESLEGFAVPFTFVCLCFMCEEVTKLSWHSGLWEIWIQTSHQGPGFQLLEGWLHVFDVVKEICFYTVCRKLMRWPIFIHEYFWALRGPHVFWQRDTAISHPYFYIHMIFWRWC